jgi:glycolate oxidase iron-sulfur subunit
VSAAPPSTAGEPRADRKSRYDIARDCVHCGMCLPVCPTYLHLGNEADSPRGRIYLMRAHDEDRQPITPAFREHLELCLVCRACESACPSGVQFGAMMEDFRALLHEPLGAAGGGAARAAGTNAAPGAAPAAGTNVPPGAAHAAGLQARLAHWLLVEVLPDPRRLHRLANLMRAYQRSGLAVLARRTGILHALGLAEREALAPAMPPAAARRPWPPVLPAYGQRRARVLFLRGCVAPEVLPEMQRASIEVLRHNGCEVVTPAAQTCCGALHFHAGFHAPGMALLERNVRGFDLGDADAVVVNAAGCGSTLKEYGRLAAERPELAPAAARFAAAVRDISEFLDELGLTPPRQPVSARVAYDEPCHLLHGQGVSAAPKRLLAAVPGLTLVPLAEADRCCGSAGVYNLQYPELAGRILDTKVACIESSGADTVATGNPGCILQIRLGLRRAARRSPGLARIRVVHPMELLAAAYPGSSA